MWILQLLLTALAAYLSAKLTPGVSITSYWAAIIVALVLGLLNVFVKPILQFISCITGSITERYAASL